MLAPMSRRRLFRLPLAALACVMVLIGCQVSAPEPPPTAPKRAAPAMNTLAPAQATMKQPSSIIAGRRPAARAPHRVILFTLDGVPPRDLKRATSGEAPLMPTLAALMTASMVVGLDEDTPGATTPAERTLSLPGYRTMMEGHVSDCVDNRCPRTTEETLLERVAAVYPGQGVAVFASWGGQHRAATHRDGSDPLVDAPAMGTRGTPERPWPDARLDVKTMKAALAHLKTTWPPLLWVALLDTDEWAHRDDRKRTNEALADSDRYLAELLQLLKNAPTEQRRPTTILISTDHGRGPGEEWPHHGSRNGSERVFIIAHGPQVTASTSSSLGPLTLADLRPTIERLLGVCSAPCTAEGCGRVIPEVLGARAKVDAPCQAPGAAPLPVRTLRR
jgi:hypothetical protein